MLAAEAAIREQATSVNGLAKVSSKHPYYKWNQIWSRQIQDTIVTILFCGWLGGLATEGNEAKQGRLLTIEEVGKVLGGKQALELL